jgi:hypothetical protein
LRISASLACPDLARLGSGELRLDLSGVGGTEVSLAITDDVAIGAGDVDAGP